MICPFCGNNDTDVYNSRPTRENTQVWRRRRCPNCHETFSTYEQINLSYLRIIKDNDQHQAYSRIRLYQSLSALIGPSGPSLEEIDELINTIEVKLVRHGQRSIYKVQYLRLVASTLAQYNYSLFLAYLSQGIGVSSRTELKALLKELS